MNTLNAQPRAEQAATVPGLQLDTNVDNARLYVRQGIIPVRSAPHR